MKFFSRNFSRGNFTQFLVSGDGAFRFKVHRILPNGPVVATENIE